MMAGPLLALAVRGYTSRVIVVHHRWVAVQVFGPSFALVVLSVYAPPGHTNRRASLQEACLSEALGFAEQLRLLFP